MAVTVGRGYAADDVAMVCAAFFGKVWVGGVRKEG